MPITQISKIQHRSGNIAELPQLSVGELGWAVDVRRLFIGNDQSVVGGITNNTEILTVNSPPQAPDGAGGNTNVYFNYGGEFGTTQSVSGPPATGNFTYNYLGNTTTNTGGNGVLTVNNLHITERAKIHNLDIDGQLTVTGNVTFNDVSTLLISDPVIFVGAGANGTPLTNNDGRDRGTMYQYYDTSEKSAFFGRQSASGNFILGNEVTYDDTTVTVGQYGNLTLRDLTAVGNISGNFLLSRSVTFDTTGGDTPGIAFTGLADRVVDYSTVGAAQSSNSTNHYSLGVCNAANTVGFESGATSGTVYGTWALATGATLEATYADIGERYTSDYDYEPGTLVMIGGPKEVTIATDSLPSRLIGVISTSPAHVLNSTLSNSVIVGLVGRVPCKVTGKISKGDMLTISSIPGVATATMDRSYIVGRALEWYDSPDVGVIEIKISS